MSGLPDAVVEAMARAIIDTQNMRMREALETGIMEPRHFTQIDLNEDEYTRDEYLEYARAALSALPAGLWHSDGKGKVVPHTVDQARSIITRELVERHPDRSWLGQADDILAALSATDTEERA